MRSVYLLANEYLCCERPSTRVGAGESAVLFAFDDGGGIMARRTQTRWSWESRDKKQRKGVWSEALGDGSTGGHVNFIP